MQHRHILKAEALDQLNIGWREKLWVDNDSFDLDPCKAQDANDFLKSLLFISIVSVLQPRHRQTSLSAYRPDVAYDISVFVRPRMSRSRCSTALHQAVTIKALKAQPYLGYTKFYAALQPLELEGMNRIGVDTMTK